MDLLFKRYGSPLPFLDMAIWQRRLPDVVTKIVEIDNRDLEWNFYLHKVDENITFSEFRDRIKNHQRGMKPIDFEAAIEKSQKILNGFTPERKEDSDGHI